MLENPVRPFQAGSMRVNSRNVARFILTASELSL
jgi:hypothetical protein